MRRPDTSLIERELGWHPQVSWLEGSRRTIDTIVKTDRTVGFGRSPGQNRFPT